MFNSKIIKSYAKNYNSAKSHPNNASFAQYNKKDQKHFQKLFLENNRLKTWQVYIVMNEIAYAVAQKINNAFELLGYLIIHLFYLFVGWNIGALLF